MTETGRPCFDSRGENRIVFGIVEKRAKCMLNCYILGLMPLLLPQLITNDSEMGIMSLGAENERMHKQCDTMRYKTLIFVKQIDIRSLHCTLKRQ